MHRLLICTFCLLLVGASLAPAAKKEPTAKKDIAADINVPRPEMRKISFQTNEGTWMSMDVSPDGNTIVFDLLGDIYSLQISGGAAKSLTSGPGFDTHPRFSPDGKTIAFTSDRGGMENLWLMDADGKNPRALTSEKDSYVRAGAWMPDGKYLVARKEDAKKAGIPPVELWMYHINGGSGIQLTSGDDMNNASGPVVSRDNRYIFFSGRPINFSYTPDVSNGLWQIYRFDRETGETSQLTEGFGGAARPALSPDGKIMTFISRRDSKTVFVARDLDSGGEKILLKDVTPDEQEGFAQMDVWPNYAFTPDGKNILFCNKGKIQKLNLDTQKTENIAFTAQVEQWLAPRVAWEEKINMGPVEARILRWPSQSSDGRWIAFDAFGRVWLQEISGGKAVGAPRRLTPDDSSFPRREYSPAFSPDGKWIAYVSWSDQEGGHIWKAPVDGGQPQKLTKSARHFANPSWSPTGDKLVVIQGSGLEFRGRQPEEEQFFEVRWLPAEGGDPQFITNVNIPNTFKFHPQAFWSKDGKRVYLRDSIQPTKPKEDPKNDLISVRLDGTDKKRYLRFPAVGDIVPSPDEQWVVFTSRDNVYVTAFPQIHTKEPPTVGLKEGSVPVWRLSDEAGGYVGWADGGKTITWGLGNMFHRLAVTDAIRFVEEQKRKEEAKKKESAQKDKGNEKKEKDETAELKVPKSESIQIQLTVPRSIPKGAFVLRGARIVTMKGDEVLENADLVVTDNRITAVGPSGKVTIPQGAKEMDAHGKTIIPGFIDTHAHLHYSGFEIFPDTKWEYIANLAYGVTTTYDPSAPSLDVFAQAEMVEAGVMLGPRTYSSGDVLYGGQQAEVFAEVNNQEDAVRQVKRMKAYGARLIKVYQQPRREQRLWFAQACRENHMLLTAEGAGELQTDLTMVLDGYTAWEHALPVEIWNDVIQLVAKSGTFYTPTLLVAYGGPWGELYFRQTMNPHDDPKLNRFVPHLTLDPLGKRHPWFAPEEYHFPTVTKGVAAIMRNGGNIALGAHGQQQGLGPHWEVWAMAGENLGSGPQAGMTPIEAIRASTIKAAEKIGYAPDLGSIETGKLADFMVLDANPLDDIHNTLKIKWVVKNGELFDAETMREEWPAQKELPKFFWAK